MMSLIARQTLMVQTLLTSQWLPRIILDSLGQIHAEVKPQLPDLTSTNSHGPMGVPVINV